MDVDGDDLAVFGEVQFTEGDILTPIDTSRPPVEEDVEVEIEGDSEDEAQREQMTLRDLVAESKVIQRRSPEESVETLKARMEEVMGVGDADRMELAILTARKRGDKGSLIIALENKVKQLVSPLPFLHGFCNLNELYRNQRRCYHRLHCSAGYVSIHTTSLPYRLVAGIPVVESAGSAVSDPQSSVPFANVSPERPICGGSFCNSHSLLLLYCISSVYLA